MAVSSWCFPSSTRPHFLYRVRVNIVVHFWRLLRAHGQQVWKPNVLLQKRVFHYQKSYKLENTRKRARRNFNLWGRRAYLVVPVLSYRAAAVQEGEQRKLWEVLNKFKLKLWAITLSHSSTQAKLRWRGTQCISTAFSIWELKWGKTIQRSPHGKVLYKCSLFFSRCFLIDCISHSHSPMLSSP